MATKMNAEIAKRVKSLGIKAADEDAAREELLKILKKNEIEGMEEEDTMTLIEIAESFVEPEQATTEEPATSGESEEELDQLAKESENEQETEDEEPEQEVAGDEFEGMSRDELKRYIKVNELEISVKKSMSDDAIRDAIRAIVNEDAKEEEPAQEEKPAEKPAKKADKKEKKAAEEKPAKKEAKTEEKKSSKRGVKLDPKNSEEDRVKFDAIRVILPESEFSYAWLSTYGVTIKYKGANSQKGVLTLENCTCRPDGSITCNMYLLTMAKQLEVLDEKGIDYKPCWTGAPGINGITFEQAVEIVTDVKDLILAAVTKSDKRLGDNRAKMEENLKKTTKKAAKK